METNEGTIEYSLKIDTALSTDYISTNLTESHTSFS